MDQVLLQTAEWYRALSLAERIAPWSLDSNQREDTGLGSQRLSRWKSQTGSPTDAEFDRRLQRFGITEHHFRYLLTETPEEIRNRIPATPSWLVKLLATYEHAPDPSTNPFSLLFPKPVQADKRAGFLKVAEPIIRDAFARFDRGMEALSECQSYLPFDPVAMRKILFRSMSGHLVAMVSRVLVLELHIARLEGKLEGDSAEERFDNYQKTLSNTETIMAILVQYPVLARQLQFCIDTWLEASLEFLNRLTEDWEMVCEAFHPDGDPGEVVDLQTGAGDPHRGGRSVVILTCRSGFKFVYKPRSLAIDIHFQELLLWLNRKGGDLSFRTLNIIDRRTHGWIEFIHAQPCRSAREVSRFYMRQGGYLALLYALEATDFHYENIIAAGEDPVLIDLETLFQPRFNRLPIKGSSKLAMDTMEYSVLRVGLLPVRLWASKDHVGIDLSGFGMPEGQITPHAIPDWEDSGTDQMRYTRKQIPMPSGNNRPIFNDEEINVLDYTDEIVAGFSKIYCLILENRKELLPENGFLARFAGDETRILFRPTETYAMLFQDSFHPDLLRDALLRERHFDKLWGQVRQQPFLERIVAYEKEDLERGDVPLFTSRPDTNDIWSVGGNCIPGLCGTSGFELVRQRLRKMCPEDLKQQLWFAKASLSTLGMSVEHARIPSYQVAPVLQKVAPNEWLQAAQEVGDHLVDLAFRGEKDASWLGLSMVRERVWSLMPLGTDFYGGLSGIVYFLAYLGNHSQQEKFTQLAQAGLVSLFQQLEEIEPSYTNLGAFQGWGGVIYILSHLAILWEREDLLDRAEGYATLLGDFIAEDEQLDILAGCAGCIGGLLTLYRCRPSNIILELASFCGNRLLEKAVQQKVGLAWPQSLPGSRPLAGFAHGAAGMAWALLELSVFTGDRRFKDAALGAIQYERGIFCAERGNWPDLREAPSIDPRTGRLRNAYITAWCHGAVGIGMARLRSLEYLKDPGIRVEAETAVRTTLANGVGKNHCLCHGDLGNLDLLLMASELWGDINLRRKTYRLAGQVLENVQSEGWLCGVPLGVETPDLMNGLAGIGYGFLRLAGPKKVPSLLALEPPPEPGSPIRRETSGPVTTE